jgi:high-affinity iron transporter
MAGKLLQGLLGYDAQPAGMQVIFFVTVFVAILIGMSWAGRRASPPAARPAAAPSTT